MSSEGNGISQLRALKDQRRKRETIPPRNPPKTKEDLYPQEKTETTSDNAPRETSDETSHAISHEIKREISPEVPSPPPSPPPSHPAPVSKMPGLHVDMSAAEAAAVSPTVMTIPASIMERFEAARRSAATHTALMLDAVRAHARELPALVLNLRPAPAGDDLFPYRATPTGRKADERREPLRIRPTAGELAVLDGLVDWVNAEIRRQRPGSPKTNRSEVVGAALDAYLPQKKRKKSTQ